MSSRTSSTGELAAALHEAGAEGRQAARRGWAQDRRRRRCSTILADDPFRPPPPFEKLVGDLSGAYSRRINIQHRLVYQVLDDEHVVKVLRMWTHYG